MPATTQRLGQGERAPDFVLPCQDGTSTRFYAKAGGRPAALLFYDTDAAAELLHFAAALNDVSAGTVALFAVTCNDSTMNPPVSGGREDLFPIFADTQGKVRVAYRLESTDKTTLFVLDPNLRVLASLSLQDAGSTARQVMALLRARRSPLMSFRVLQRGARRNGYCWRGTEKTERRLRGQGSLITL